MYKTFVIKVNQLIVITVYKFIRSSKYLLKKEPKVSIIVDLDGVEKEKAEKIVQEIKITTYKNYEIITINKNNILENDKNIEPKENKTKFKTYSEAIKMAEGEYFIIFDKNLLSIDRKDYIERLLGICQNKNVAIVGTKLYNEQELVEHAGIILGMNGVGDFLYKGAPKNIGTYMQRLTIIHNVSCVYIKYAMISKKAYEEVNGFDEKEKGIFASIDFCLKQLEKKKQVILNPIIAIKIKELSDVEKIDEQEKFIDKWKDQYKKGDIYFSPNLSKADTGLSFNI